MTWVERLVRAFTNPLILKDGISRMRTWRAPFIITLYLGLLGLFSYTIFVLATLGDRQAGSAQVGGIVFAALALIQLSLVSLFAPALAAGAITGERERRTFDMLLVSRVSPAGIVWGKLVASVAFMLLLILAALPLFAAVFLFGGIDFGQFLATQLLTVTTAISLGAASLFASALFGRTLTSTVVAYGIAFFAMVGTLIIGELLSIAVNLRTGGTGGDDVHPLLFVNPFYSMYQLLEQPNGAPMHLGRLFQLLFLTGGSPAQVGPLVEPWVATVVLQIVITALALFGAVQLIQGWRPVVRPAPESEAESPAPAEEAP
jgi:ABC-2 type transport system permease protein